MVFITSLFFALHRKSDAGSLQSPIDSRVHHSPRSLPLAVNSPNIVGQTSEIKFDGPSHPGYRWTTTTGTRTSGSTCGILATEVWVNGRQVSTGFSWIEPDEPDKTGWRPVIDNCSGCLTARYRSEWRHSATRHRCVIKCQGNQLLLV